MTQCPKCESVNIHGPFYQRGRYGGEHLVYRCGTCGYSENRPTADSKESEPHPWAQTLHKHLQQ
jgi:hypothetical protein